MALKSSKQEAFCQAVVSGMSQADAYRSAYNAEKMKNETIQKRASELIRDGEVKGRLQELRGKLENTQLWTREMAVSELLENVKMCKRLEKPEPLNNAVKILNSMHGYDAPTKFELTHKKTVADLDDEELAAYEATLLKKG